MYIYIYMCFFTCYLITGVITYNSATNWDEPPSGGFLSHGATPQVIPSKNPGCCLLMFISLNQLLSYPHFRTPPSRSFLWRCPKAQVGWPQLLCCAWNTLGLQLVPRAGPNFTKPMSYHHSPQLSTVKSVLIQTNYIYIYYIYIYVIYFVFWVHTLLIDTTTWRIESWGISQPAKFPTGTPNHLQISRASHLLGLDSLDDIFERFPDTMGYPQFSSIDGFSLRIH